MAHDKDTTDKFPAGLIVKHPHENAPDFVRAKLHIVKKEFMQWLEGREDDWINCDIKLSKNGKFYVQVDDWKPAKPQGVPTAEDGVDGLPF